MKVGVLGATGYAGQELVRLLKRHEEVEDLYLASSSVAGEDYESVYPHWSGQKVGLLSGASFSLERNTQPPGPRGL